MRSYFRVVMFLSSYAPLFLIIAILNLKTKSLQDSFSDLNEFIKIQEPIVWILTILSIVSGSAVFILRQNAKKITSERLILNTVKKNNTDSMSYIATYLLPFISAQLNSWNLIVANILMFSTIAIVYVKSEIIHTNPLFLIFGLNVFEAEEENGNKVFIISKKFVFSGAVFAVNIHKNLYWSFK